MSASYNGHEFEEKGDSGLNVPGFDKKFVIVEKIIPNGEPVVQSIGAAAPRLAMPIRCTLAQWNALDGDSDGDAHTLVWSCGSDSALLESLTPHIEVKPGEDVYFSVLNFIKL